MSEAPVQRGRDVGVSLFVAILLVAAWFLWLGDVGIDPSDEGFLWYGAVRVGEGAVPVRDFQSYEPGRYYWIAAGAWLMGPGLLAFRASVAAFLALGLTCGLQVAGRVVAHPTGRIAAGLVLMAWAFPRHKIFEPALAMAAALVAVRLVERPDFRRHLQAGAFVGLALFFGRNHALYAGLGLTAVLLWSHWKRGGVSLPRSIGGFGLGGLLGATPLLAMLLFVPGFAGSFLESVVFFIRHGVNVPLPFPWPWRLTAFALGPVAVGVAFLLVPALIACGLWIAWRGDPGRRAVQVVVACSSVGLFYAHHASVRSDVFHLAQAIPPVLLAALALPVAFVAGTAGRAAVWGGVALLSGVVGLTMNPLVIRGLHGDLVEHRLGRDVLRIPAPSARFLRNLERAVGERVGPEEPMLIVPFSPGLYPILGKRAPIRSLYLLWHATDAEQREMIRVLEKAPVDWVLLENRPFGHDERLRFRNSHPLVWSYLEAHYWRIREPRLPRELLLLHRRPPAAEGPSGAWGGAGREALPCG